MDSFSSIAARLVEPTRWIVIMGIAFTLAVNVLFFVSPPEAGISAGPAAATATRTPDRSNNVSINAVLSRNLFGEAGATTEVQQSTAPSVETRLPLELLGVFVADEGKDSAAIVAQKGRGGELYVIGQNLPGNAELIEVHTDHIVLRRAGNRETLRFPELVGDQVVASAVPAANRRASSRSPRGARQVTDEDQPPWQQQGASNADWAEAAPSPKDFISAYKDKITDDPEGTLTDLGISPVSAGNASGYKLDSAAARSPYLSKTGLQPGDVILSVNGEPVGNVQRDSQRIDNILAQGSARLEVQRGTRKFFVKASLN